MNKDMIEMKISIKKMAHWGNMLILLNINRDITNDQEDNEIVAV